MKPLSSFVAAIRRLLPWWIASALLIACVAYLSPQQFSILVYKLALVTVSVKVAYLADRWLFRNAPPIKMSRLVRAGLTDVILFSARMLARALIYVGTVLGLTLGI